MSFDELEQVDKIALLDASMGEYCPESVAEEDRAAYDAAWCTVTGDYS